MLAEGNRKEGIRQQKLTVELIWWVFTFLVICVIMLPIWIQVPLFPFTWQNVLLIILFITYSRYIFFLPLTFIARMKWIKVGIIASAVLLFFVTATALLDFRSFMDERGLQTLVEDLHVEEQTAMIFYMKHEMIFFGVGSLITGVLLPIRMIVSLWRMRNKGTV